MCMKNFTVKKLQLMRNRTRIVKMWQAGMTPREISHCLRFSVSTIYRWLRHWRREKELIASLYDQHLFTFQTAREAALRATLMFHWGTAPLQVNSCCTGKMRFINWSAESGESTVATMPITSYTQCD